MGLGADVPSDEEHRVARARRPGGGGHRERRLVGARQQDVPRAGRRSASGAAGRSRRRSRRARPPLTGCVRSPRGAVADPIVKTCCPVGSPSRRGERPQRVGGEVGDRVTAGDQDRRADGRRHQARRGEPGGPIVVLDEAHRGGALDAPGRGKHGKGDAGRVRDGVERRRRGWCSWSRRRGSRGPAPPPAAARGRRCSAPEPAAPRRHSASRSGSRRRRRPRRAPPGSLPPRRGVVSGGPPPR